METTDPSTPDSTTPQPPAPARRLTRSSDRRIGGVAAGIAEYFGIDPTIVRLIFVAAIFLGGFGLIMYLIGWLVLPPDDGSGASSAPHTLASTSSTVVAFGLLVAGAIVAAATIDNPFGGGFLVPVLLVAAGVFLLIQSPDEPPSAGRAVAQAPAPPTATPGPPAVRTPVAVGLAAPAPPSTPVEPTPPAPPITSLVFSALALVIAAAFFAEAANLFDVSPTAVVAVCLATIGVGLVAAAIWGGGRGLIPMGLFTTAALLISSVAAPAFDDGVGERDFAPSTLAEVRTEYRHGIGEMRVDLSAVEFPDGEHRIDTHLGIGELRVIVPDDVTVELSGELDIGEVDVFGRRDSGIGNDVDSIRSVDSDATLRIDVDAGVGHVVVEAQP